MYKIIPCKVPAGNNPVRDYSSVETFDRTAPPHDVSYADKCRISTGCR
ncbi:MAG: hypothetical protein LBG45_03110 [Dysgonamonadaceae bacterium]|nr:hypothetical protein [Dysgonamonadaceae bacterium]